MSLSTQERSITYARERKALVLPKITQKIPIVNPPTMRREETFLCERLKRVHEEKKELRERIDTLKQEIEKAQLQRKSCIDTRNDKPETPLNLQVKIEKEQNQEKKQENKQEQNCKSMVEREQKSNEMGQVTQRKDKSQKKCGLLLSGCHCLVRLISDCEIMEGSGRIEVFCLSGGKKSSIPVEKVEVSYFCVFETLFFFRIFFVKQFIQQIWNPENLTRSLILTEDKDFMLCATPIAEDKPNQVSIFLVVMGGIHFVSRVQKKKHENWSQFIINFCRFVQQSLNI